MTQGLGKKDDQRQNHGLRNKGNRVLVGIGVGLIVSYFAGLLDAETAPQLMLWVVAAAITYAIATPRD